MASQPFYKKSDFWIGLIGLILTTLALLLAYSEHLDKISEQEQRTGAELEKQRALAQEHEATKKLQELQERIEKEKGSLPAFLSDYRDYLTRIRMAVSKYQETKSPDDEKQLKAVTQAFVDFVKSWRDLQRILADMLDGQVTRMEAAAAAGDLEELEAARRTLEEGLDSKKLLLEKGLERLK